MTITTEERNVLRKDWEEFRNSSKSEREKAQLAKTSAQRQATRRAPLNEKAKELGFDSWGILETAVINDKIVLKCVANDNPQR